MVPAAIRSVYKVILGAATRHHFRLQIVFYEALTAFLTACYRPVPSMSRGFPLQHRLSTSQSAAFLPAHSLVSDRSVVQQLSAVSADLQQAASTSALFSEASVAQQFFAPQSELLDARTYHYQQSDIQRSVATSVSQQQPAELISGHSFVQQSSATPFSPQPAFTPVSLTEAQETFDSSSNYRFQSTAASSVTQQQSADTYSAYPVLHSPEVAPHQPQSAATEPVAEESPEPPAIFQSTSVTSQANSAFPAIPSFHSWPSPQQQSQHTELQAPVQTSTYTSIAPSAMLLPLPQAAAAPVTAVTRDLAPVASVQPSVPAYTASAAIAASNSMSVAPSSAAQPFSLPATVPPLQIPALPVVSASPPSAQRALLDSSVLAMPVAAPPAFSNDTVNMQPTNAPVVPDQAMQQTRSYEPHPTAGPSAPVLQFHQQSATSVQSATSMQSMATLSAPSQPIFPRPIGSFSYTAPAAPVARHDADNSALPTTAASQATYVSAPPAIAASQQAYVPVLPGTAGFQQPHATAPAAPQQAFAPQQAYVPAPPSVASRDAYIPAVAFSPARTRVSRDLPADAELGHVRKSSFAANALDQWPATGSAAATRRELEPQSETQLQETAYASSAMQSREVVFSAPPPTMIQSGTATSSMMQSTGDTASASVTVQPQPGFLIPGTVTGPGVTSNFIPPAPLAAASNVEASIGPVPPGYYVTPPGPVCEGHETKSDTWSITDSVASDPDAPVLAGQNPSADVSEPAKQSRFSRLLSRNKSSESASGQQQATASQAAGAHQSPCCYYCPVCIGLP